MGETIVGRASVGLVGCGKLKASTSCHAREMYLGSLFKYASAYCERVYDRWFILSAKYGLLAPDTVIDPYDMTLIGMSKAEKRAWQNRVLEKLDRDCVYYLHAGKHYMIDGIKLLTPMKGLGIGEQLAWYKKRLNSFVS